MCTRFVLLLTIILNVLLSAQIQLQWEKTYDFSNHTEQLTHSCIDKDNNLFILGKTYDQSLQSKAIIIKYSPDGDLMWLKHSGYDAVTEPVGIYTDAYLNVYIGISGYDESTNWKTKFRLIKYDKDGTQKFDRQYEYMANLFYGEDDLLGSVNKMFQDNEHKIILGGTFRNLAFFVKIDEAGIVVHQTLDTLQADPVYPYFQYESIFYDKTSGSIYTGFQRHDYISSFLSKFCIIKQNSTGEIVWDKSFYEFGTDDYNSFITSMTCDNGAHPTFALYISKATFVQGDTLNQPHLLKTDNDGEPLWDVRFYAKPGIEYSTTMEATCKDAGGNILLTGGYNNAFVIQKYSNAGELLWSDTDTTLMEGTHIIADGNDPIVAVSDFHGNVYIRRYSWQGNLLSEYFLEGISEYAPVEAVALSLDDDKNIIFAGNKKNGYSYDFYLVKLRDESLSVENNTSELSYQLHQNYPNPFNPETKINFSTPVDGNIKIVVTDILGRELEVLASGYFEQGEYSVLFNGDGYSSGIYFYAIYTENFSKVKKMILLK